MRVIKRRLPWLCFVILIFTYAAPSPAQEAERGVRVTLSLASGKAVYRQGEPIRLALSFTAEGDRYQLNTTTTKPASPIDEVIISTDAGVTRWLDEFSGKHRYSPDYAAIQKLGAAPTTVDLTLNDWFRFDRPGRYSVRVKTGRVSRQGEPGEAGAQPRLTTNEVSFEVVPMSAAEEEQEVKRLSALLDAASGWRAEAAITEELSYLSGEASTREKVRRFLDPQDRSGNYFQNIYHGLFIARDRALVVRLLEGGLRDPNTPATHQLLNTLTRLRLLQEGVEPPPSGYVLVGPGEGGQAQRRASEILEEYVRELAASLPKRSGKSLTTAAITILTNVPKERAQSSQPLAAAREVILKGFDGLHPFEQEHLLRAFWEQLRDPSLQPALERILAKERQPQGYLIRGSALKRLIELDPARARPFVVAELRDPTSLVDLDTLVALDYETLPEADAALLEQIRRLAPLGQRGDFIYLRQKALLAQRYASPAVYDGLMEVYQTFGAKWQPDARAGLLGYFARYNETQAAPLIEQALSELGPGADSTFLFDLTRTGYPEAVAAIVRKQLESDDPQAVSTAAYIMSKRGPAEDRRLLEARLERWMKEWGARAAELDAAGNDPRAVNQAMAQVNLILSLMTAKSWKLPEERVRQLKQSCVTRACRQNYQIR